MIGYLEKTIQIIPLQEIEIGDEGNFVSQIENELNARFLLSKLNEIQQTIIELKISGYKIKEIAEKTGYPARHINYRLEKIRRIIREFI